MAIVVTMASLGCQAPSPARRNTPIPEASQRLLKVTPLVAVVGQTVEVEYESWGSSGCYRQSETSTRLRGQEYTHEYETWSVGSPMGPCTANMVHGGARARFEPTRAGIYQGVVVKDGRTVAAYTLRVVETAAEVERQALALLPVLTRWERLQLLRQSADFQPGVPMDDLNAAGEAIVRAGVDRKEIEAVVAWLDSEAGEALAPELGPLMGGMNRARSIASQPPSP